MLSILIPIYNQEVVKLVDSLQKQCVRSKINYEILCYDDGSKESVKKANTPIASYFGVNYTELSQNLGRAKIRNWLAKTASFDNLLFLDCDSKLVGRKFISTYVDHLGEADVISGGRIYSKKAPRAKSKKLHWIYGKYRESKPPKFRNKHPYLFFHSNNFVIKRDIMLKFPFDENIKGYGYEDLLLAESMKKEGIEIKHIDNPVQHLGLEKAKVFLDKTENAIKNLIQLKLSGNGITTRLEKLATKLENWGVQNIFMRFYRRKESSIKANLLSDKPRIRYLDAFKLYCYYRIKNSLTAENSVS